MTAARRAFVMVWDGMRPDLVSPELTPTLWALAARGVRFSDSHAVFPTVTRINSATLATGCLPSGHGIVGNSLYSPAIDPSGPFNTGDHRALEALRRIRGGRLLPCDTLADRVARAGGRTVVVSTGSPGSALLCHPRVRDWPNDRLLHRAMAVPDDGFAPIVERFGPIPEQTIPNTEQNAYFARATAEYVLPELDPRLLIFWHTDPDKTQHARGFGHPDSLASIRDADANLGTILATIDACGLAAETAVAVVSDHGYATIDPLTEPRAAFAGTDLLDALADRHVVLAGNGGALFAYAPSGDAPGGDQLIRRVARAFQAWEHGGPVFVGTERGANLPPGTLPLDAVGISGDLAPDVVCALDWDDRANAYGYAGRSAGLDPKIVASHGGISSWEVRNTFVLAGAGVKQGLVDAVPAGNVDLAPTLLHLLGLDPTPGQHGRVVAEALAGGPDPATLHVEREILTAEHGAYRQGIRRSSVAGHRYLDYGWRGG